MTNRDPVTVPSFLIVVIVVVVGFLTGSTVYFYNKSRVSNVSKNTGNEPTFDSSTVPQTPSKINESVDAQTKPAEPKGRLSYPANIYTVQPKESLFGIGTKLGVSYQLIKRANNIKDENLIQAGTILAVPKLSLETDYYRLNFLINAEKATEINKELRDVNESEWYDPTQVAKKHAPPYFGITELDQLRLVEADLANGKALVEAKLDNRVNYIGLIQPKTKGQKGLWAIVYIESRND